MSVCVVEEGHQQQFVESWLLSLGGVKNVGQPTYQCANVLGSKKAVVGGDYVRSAPFVPFGW